MEYPKKITKKYERGEEPAIIIRVSGEGRLVKRAEYHHFKQCGKMHSYKK